MPNQRAKVTIKLWDTFKATIKLWRANFNLFTKVVLVVAVPSSILNVLNTQGMIGEYGLLLSLAWSFVIIAVLLLAKSKPELSNTKLSTVYTAASARLLQYVAVSLVLIIFALPMLLGLFGIFLATPVFGVSPLVALPVAVLGFVLGSYLLTRFSISQSITVNNGASIYQSLKLSAELTKGNRLRVFIGFFIILVSMLVVLMAVQFVLSINQAINENSIISGVVYILEAVVFVPIGFIFQQKVCEALENEKTRS